MIKIYKDDKAYSGKIQPANMRHKHPGMLRKDNGFNLAATVPLPWACRFLNVPPIWNGQGQGDRTMLFFFGCQRYRLLVEIGRGFVCWTMLEAANSPAIGSRWALQHRAALLQKKTPRETWDLYGSSSISLVAWHTGVTCHRAVPIWFNWICSWFFNVLEPYADAQSQTNTYTLNHFGRFCRGTSCHLHCKRHGSLCKRLVTWHGWPVGRVLCDESWRMAVVSRWRFGSAAIAWNRVLKQ